MAIDAVRLRKVYGPTVALADASLQVEPGEIHGLLGENGAGKSTLVRLLAGVESPDQGALGFFGSPLQGGPLERNVAGLAVIHQDLGLFDKFSVSDNIAFAGGFRRRAGLIDERGSIADAREISERVGFEVDPRRLVGELTIAEQTMVAVCRALAHRARVIVLDEPTAYLEARQVHELFDLLARLRDDGVACVLITHRCEEILRVCDRVTVLRDGRDVARRSTDGLSESELVRLITGRSQKPVNRTDNALLATGTVRVRVENLCGLGFGPVSFSVNRSEILGICGLADAGQSALGESLCGRADINGGGIELDDKPYRPRDVRDALRAGVGMPCVPASVSCPRIGSGTVWLDRSPLAKIFT